MELLRLPPPCALSWYAQVRGVAVLLERASGLEAAADALREALDASAEQVRGKASAGSPAHTAEFGTNRTRRPFPLPTCACT